VRLSTMQEAILKSPMMTKSFLNRQAKFSSDREESMGSLDNIMQREMARADTPINGSPVMSPGRLGSASTISSSPGMDASVVVEQALLELDGVLNETREMQLKASARVPRASAINLEPVIAIEETEDDEDEQARAPPPLQSQWSRQIQQPKMVVPELHAEEVARAQEEEVVPLPLASPKPSVAKRMCLTMVATPVRSSEILDPEDIPVSPPLSPSSGRTKRLPPKILFEPAPKPAVVEVPKYVGPAPRAGSLAAAAEAEERSGKLPPDREALLRDLLQQGIITDAEYEQRMERIRPPRKVSTGSEAPPVPEFPGVDAFGLQDDEFADPLSFDSIMSRNIALPQSPEPAAYGMSPPPKNAVFTSPVMPPISMPKNVALKGTPPKPLSCSKCGTTMPPELKIEVRFCPSCGNKIR
jgi:hypothetical protein